MAAKAADGTSVRVPLIDVAAQRRRLGKQLDEAVQRVMDRGTFIMGPEVSQLEAALCDFCGAPFTVTCSSGTDALILALLAEQVTPKDAVFCPSLTFVATAEAVVFSGAIPVFVDVLPETFNLDPASLEAAIDTARSIGLRPRAVIPVDLFGLPADYGAISAIAERTGMAVIGDAAQSFGAEYRDRKVGSVVGTTAVSFFPSKPLGAYGDGGALFTHDEGRAEILRSLRVHGGGAHKYDNVRIGLNARLDTLQAAVLIEELRIFPDEVMARRRIAARYARVLGAAAHDRAEGRLVLPVEPPDCRSAWAHYTVRIVGGGRDMVAARLRAQGIATAVYYVTPLHHQPAYREFPVAASGLEKGERAASEVLSLPMHAYLDEATQDRVAAALVDAVAQL